MIDDLVDIYDDAEVWLGTKERSRVHRDGDWHRTFHCWVVAPREGELRFVMQRRGRNLIEYPGLIDVSVGGHLLAGETEQGGLREVREELGIEIAFDRLVRLGDYRFVTRIPGYYSREITVVYALWDERALERYAPDVTEVDALVEVGIADVAELALGTRTEIDAIEFSATTAEKRRHRVRTEEFIFDFPAYLTFAVDSVRAAFSR